MKRDHILISFANTRLVLKTKSKEEQESLARMFDPFYQEKIKASIEKEKFDIFCTICDKDEKEV